MKFVLLVLATWRITSMVVREDGPFSAFARLRKLIGVRYDAHSVAYGTNTLAEGILCVWCASVWFSFFAAFLNENSSSVFEFLISWLAISTAVIALDELINLLGRICNRD